MDPPVKCRSGKKNFLIRTWDRYRSSPDPCKKMVAPEGFFPVYVGPEKQWFTVNAKYANHSLFQMLLQDAEIEYGYNTPGPILHPCEVDLFYRVLAEMEAKEMQPRGFRFGHGPCSPFNPSWRLAGAGGSRMGKGYGGYGVFTSSQLVNMN